VAKSRMTSGQIIGKGRKRGRLGNAFKGRLALMSEIDPETKHPKQLVIVAA
jgi:hypothetical protein